MPIINSVIAGGGTTPTGTKNITTNGIHDVAAYASADVQVPTTAPAKYVAYTLDANNALVSTGPLLDFSGVYKIPEYGFYATYAGRSGVTGTPDLSSITNIELYGLYQCFKNSGISGAIDLSSASVVRAFALTECFYNTGITSLDLSAWTGDGSNPVATNASSIQSICAGCSSLQSANLGSVSGFYGENCAAGAFKDCVALTNVNLSSLAAIGISSQGHGFVCRSMFYGCSALTSINLSSLKKIYAGYNNNNQGSGGAATMFQNCSGLVSVDLSSLETLGNSGGNKFSSGVAWAMFSGCSSLVTIKFQSLKEVGRYAMNYAFSNCSSLQSIWFYALNTNSFAGFTNQFSYLLENVDGCTVHFPMAIQATIGSWSDVTNGFGGTNTTVLFDLVTSLTGADTNAYTRSEKDSTATATAWTYNDTLYYTSGVSDNTNGVNEPSVGDTIYSDAACTTAVTTISAIA